MSYGVTTDPWSFADSVNNMKTQSYGKEESVGGEAQCVDSVGDVAASTTYDTDNATVTASYKACSDTALVFYDTATSVDFRPGKVIAGNVITGIEVSFSNTERPTVTISGEYAHGVADGSFAKYDPSDLEIAGTRKATPVGVTADSLSKVTGSSVSASVSVSKSMDSLGATFCMDVHGGRVEASTDLVGCTGAAGAAIDTGWTRSSGAGIGMEQTAYATGAYSVFKNLTAM